MFHFVQSVTKYIFSQSPLNLPPNGERMGTIDPIGREIERGTGRADAVELQLAPERVLGRNSKIEDFCHLEKVPRSR